MDDPHLAVLRQWMTAPELDKLRKELGSADSIADLSQQVRQIIKAAEHRKAIWNFVKVCGVALASVMGVLTAIKALLPADWWLP